MAEKETKTSVADLASSFIRKIGYTDLNGVEKQILRFWRGDFYLWQGGAYAKLSNDEMKTLMVKAVAFEKQVATTGLLDNLKLHIMAGTLLGQSRVPNTWINEIQNATMPVEGIVLNNGIITIKDAKPEIMPLSPDFFCLGVLPYNYDSDAECPRWMQFLDEVTGNNKEDQRLLQQWAGYLLITTHKYQSFLLLIGEAATGKGTFARVMKEMLGTTNCSDIPLRRFTDKFSLYLTYGKRLNVAGDAEQELTPQAEAVIKTWTGEDGLDYERKYGEGFTANPTAKLMILCNDFPNFTDKSMGTWRRLKLVRFHRKNMDYMEKDLGDKLRGELPGILNWAIQGAIDLENNQGFSISRDCKLLSETYQQEANPARIFLAENYTYQENYEYGIPRSHLYDAYRRWCDKKGYQKMSDRTFGKEVRRVFPDVGERQLGGRYTRHRIHKGLVIQKGAEIASILANKW